MSKCIDCLHYNICTFGKCDIISGCPHFTARSEWMHLPCKVGDKVYCLWKSCGSGVWDIHETSVYSIMLTDDNLVKIYISPACGYTKKEKRLFFTREKAEKALEIMKNESKN